MKRLPFGIALALIALIAGSLPGAAADPPFELNVVMSQTGAYAFQGLGATKALEIIERVTNKGGGINGRPIKFVITDDQSSPVIAVQAANAIVAKGATVILGPVATAPCTAVAALAANGPVMYCFSPGIHPKAGSYVFSSGVSTLDTLAASKKFFGLHGWQKIAFITSTDATGQDADRNIDSVFGDGSGGMTIVAHEHFNPTDLNVAAQMSRIEASGAQALVAWTTGTPFGTVLRSASEAGMKIPVLTTAANLSDAEMRAYGAYLPAQLYIPGTPAFAPDQIPPGPLKTALGGYLGALKADGAKAENATSLAWDGTLVVIEALRKVGLNANATQIRDYIAGLHSGVGIYGKHDFVASPQRGLGIGAVVMVRWDPARGWLAASAPGVAALR
jgi:branched-chain amino acid transport system substrate-binding protein